LFLVFTGCATLAPAAPPVGPPTIEQFTAEQRIKLAADYAGMTFPADCPLAPTFFLEENWIARLAGQSGGVVFVFFENANYAKCSGVRFAVCIFAPVVGAKPLQLVLVAYVQDEIVKCLQMTPDFESYTWDYLNQELFEELKRLFEEAFKGNPALKIKGYYKEC
jgi:hypothetical protein